MNDNRGLHFCPEMTAQENCEGCNYHHGDLCHYLEENFDKCRECPTLIANGVKNFVPGEGPLDAELFFVGRDPGFYEQKYKRPFFDGMSIPEKVMNAGAILTAHFEKVGIKRIDTYITNSSHCQPKGNLDPGYWVRERCSFNLRWELALVNPKIIVGVGNQAFLFLKSSRRIKDKFRIMFMNHPSAQLRGSVEARKIREQLMYIKKTLEEM